MHSALVLALAALPAVLCAPSTSRVGITRLPLSDDEITARLEARRAAVTLGTPFPRGEKFPKLSCDVNTGASKGRFSEYPGYAKACANHAALSEKYLLRSGQLPIARMTNFDNELWVGNVQVATPLQPSPSGAYAVVLDSGSSNFWIPSAACNDTGCASKQKYDATISTTAHAVSKNPFLIPYGTGFSAGTFVADDVTLAGMHITNVTFGQADVVAAFFADTPIDGILGLAFEDISVGHEKPVFDYAWERGLLARREFSVYMSDKSMTHNSEVVFGGTDPFHYTGEFHYADVLLPSYWVVGMEGINVGGNQAHHCGLDYCLAVIDTGTTGIVGPPYALDPVIKDIGHVAEDCSNVGDLPNVSFKIAGKDLTMTPLNYVLTETFSNGTSVCQLGIQAMWLTSPLYILGTSFIQANYAVFDKSGIIPKVGFAPSR